MRRTIVLICVGVATAIAVLLAARLDPVGLPTTAPLIIATGVFVAGALFLPHMAWHEPAPERPIPFDPEATTGTSLSDPHRVALERALGSAAVSDAELDACTHAGREAAVRALTGDPDADAPVRSTIAELQKGRRRRA